MSIHIDILKKGENMANKKAERKQIKRTFYVDEIIYNEIMALIENNNYNKKTKLSVGFIVRDRLKKMVEDFKNKNNVNYDTILNKEFFKHYEKRNE